MFIVCLQVKRKYVYLIIIVHIVIKLKHRYLTEQNIYKTYPVWSDYNFLSDF